jgi:hypothetical protein
MVSVRFSDEELAEVTAGAVRRAAPCGESAGGRPNVRGFVRDAAVSKARGAPEVAPVVAPGTAPAPPPAVGYVGHACGEVITPQGDVGACYELRSAESIITSHKPGSWVPDPRYPVAVQERDYQRDINEQAKVLRIAQAPRPDLLLATTPTAVDGPPIVSAAGIALGGNGRAMGVRLAYKDGTAEDYRRELRTRAAVFGLKPEDVDAIRDPMLVRVVRGLDGASQAELAAASSQFNQGMTNSMDERARAVSLSRRLSGATLTSFGDQLDEHETLRAAMAASGKVFVDRLTRDEIITAQNRAEYVAGDGGLTEAGKLLVEGAVMGLVVGTSDRLRDATPATLAKVERLAPFLARVAARKNGHDLTPLVQAAMDLLHSAQLAQMPAERYGSQARLGEAMQSPDVVTLADRLERVTSKRLASAARQWAAVADYDPNQSSIFGHPAPETTRRQFLEDSGRES